MSVTDLTVLDPVIKEHYSPFEIARIPVARITRVKRRRRGGVRVDFHGDAT